MQVEANEVLKPKTRRRRIPRIAIEGERGQVIVLIALLVVILLGFTALAIDGGGLFLLQRDAQNAADAAALAGAYAKCTKGNVDAAAKERAELDGFPDMELIGGPDVDVLNPSPQGAQYVEVVITADKPSYFAHLIFSGPLRVTVRSIGECIISFDPDAAAAVMALSPCYPAPGSCPSTTDPTVSSSVSDSTIIGGINGGCGCKLTGANTQLYDDLSCMPDTRGDTYDTCDEWGNQVTCNDGDPDDDPEPPVDPFAGFWVLDRFRPGGQYADWAQADEQCALPNRFPGKTRWTNGQTENDCYIHINTLNTSGFNKAGQDLYFEGLYMIEDAEPDFAPNGLNVGPAGATFVSASGKIHLDPDFSNNVEPYDPGPDLNPTFSPTEWNTICDLSATGTDDDNTGWPDDKDYDNDGFDYDDPDDIGDDDPGPHPDANKRCSDPPTDYLLVFTMYDDPTCSVSANGAGVSTNGAGRTWSGIIYAPKSACTFAGESQKLYGAFICRKVDLSAARSDIIFDPSMLPSVPPATRYGPG